jgi:uncharacterized protein (TIGR00266 family)
LFVNEFKNNTTGTRRVTLVQTTTGDIASLDLSGGSICLQPGAYLASTPGIKIGLKWAGFASYFGGEGLFQLVAPGHGTVWYGAFGALLEREVDGELIVDTSHLVAYEPQLKLGIQMAGGIFSSFLALRAL